MTIRTTSIDARCISGFAQYSSSSPRAGIQYIAREPSLDVRDLTVDLAEPVGSPWRDDDDVSGLDVVGPASLDSRRPVLGIRQRPAGRIGSGAFEDVVHLGHILTVAVLGVDAGVVRSIQPAANDERVH